VSATVTDGADGSYELSGSAELVWSGSAEPAESALGGVSVVDLTSGVGGAYAGKLLADLGAQVVMVEPSGGSPLRRRPPAAGLGRDGALFEHLSGGKQSVVPDGPDDARRLLADLLWTADVLLLDGTSPWPLPAAARPDHLVEVDLSPFGRTGPYAGWRGSDIAVWAMGGYLYFTGFPSREPVWVPGSQAALHGGVHGAFAALVGLYERRRSGFGQGIELSELEAVLSAHAWLVSSWAACGQVLPRVESDLVRAADGWVYFMRIVPLDNLFVLIEQYDMIEENLTESIPLWFENVPRIFALAAEWAKDKTVDQIVEAAQELRVPVTPVLDAAGVADDPQLEARGWWERDPAGDNGPGGAGESGAGDSGGGEGGDEGLAFPGQPFHLSATPARRRGRAPAVGEHTGQVRAGIADALVAGRPVRSGRVAGSDRPLAGLRVVEVTNNWAGPACGRHLADLGADVLKVEWATRPATRALFWPGPTQDQQRQGHHRAMYFNEMNRNKRGVVIDLSKPAGRDVFLELIADTDVLIENNSARVMPNLDLAWDTLSAVNPRLVMVSMSGYGASGPRRDWVAYGSNIETTSGLTSTTGYPDGEMSRTTLFYADPVSGIHGAVAVMAALEHRHRTGQGQWIEMSLNECGAAFCCEALTSYRATGEVRSPSGNRDPRFAPHGVYPCAGADFWVAIAVQSDEDWLALARAMGRDDLAGDKGLATLEGRQARHDELDREIAVWTSGLEQYEVAWELQRRGVSAAPVLANWQILPDPHLRQRGAYMDVEFPVVGVYPTTTWPWHFSRTPAAITRPAPLFAEHNREILAEAGLSEQRIADLYAEGITADEPAV
jgi:crotonobetainyl-CoA:carnitine CoA-transferase CaiB-like acyl-CoA transferase